MTEFRQFILKELKEKRPNISDSSLKTYTSNLFNINKKLNGEQDLSFFKNHDDLLKYIKTEMKSTQTQKTLLCALFILTGLDAYRDVMLEYSKQVNDRYKTQKMTEKQQEHRISFDEVREKVNTLFNAMKANPSKENYELYLIACFSSGVFSPPRRAEFANIKIKNYHLQHDNYLISTAKQKKIVFNKYKTAKRYGTQEYIIPAQVMPILRKYLKMNTSDYLFPKKDGEHPMSNVDYNRMLQKIFGKGISVDALRSIFLSERYKDIPAIHEMEATATAMGNDFMTGLKDYVKK